MICSSLKGLRLLRHSMFPMFFNFSLFPPYSPAFYPSHSLRVLFPTKIIKLQIDSKKSSVPFHWDLYELPWTISQLTSTIRYYLLNARHLAQHHGRYEKDRTWVSKGLMHINLSMVTMQRDKGSFFCGNSTVGAIRR